MLGRFPGRNQFIARYIWEHTGQWRTPKQVGSRLQQLRESCVDEELRALLFPTALKSPPDRDASEGQGYGPTAEVPRRMVCIDILPRGVLAAPPSLSPPPSPLSDCPDIHISQEPRSLARIDPTITFVSRTPIVAQSKFKVCLGNETIHVENVPLEFVRDAPLPDPSAYLYRTSLVPGFWKSIVASSDPTRYTICQEVTAAESCAVAFSAVYKFSYPAEYSTGFDTFGISPLNGSMAGLHCGA